MQNDKRTVKVYQTAKLTGDKMTQKLDLSLEPDKSGIESSLINVYPDVVYQEIEGFGGAFTEAAADTLYKLGDKNRSEILNAYFSPDTGLGYTLCRTHINSCDFSLGNYAYVEKAGDVNLDTFTIERDKKALIPFIHDAMNVEGASFKIFASPWSPPAWMKTNGKMNEGGKLKKEYEDVWAKYFARYIKTYASEGINIWGVTVQNEPKAAQTWDSCLYTAEEERDFVKYNLGPTLEKSGLGDVKIIVWDHNKERVYERANVIFSDSEAAKYIWGIGFHWYSGDHFEGLEAAHHKFPDKKLLFTEGCVEGGSNIGSWNSGERYAHEIIGDLNNWSVGWTDWNMLLNEKGGPNHVGNYCAAPIIADTKNDTLHYESSFYYIGHFSKFIRPGYKRIGCSRFTDKLETVAFKGPDGRIVVVVMNRTEEEITFNLRHDTDITAVKSLPRSIITLVF
jgi:glucosylceramidase